ncbi:hypothetical protein [Micromonospora sp. LH3U1]|uniref:hypothetical protein n=1 Tax=Micromonospora sp. LH3U1 TaxID=3018339 RepID=UPI00234B3F87|nr:hypothetical protein [Micromonospora sp. LH3U1]WCN80018.1 hypothetical protein PCA76_24125 [Micromonospora sp. LH3U1]
MAAGDYEELDLHDRILGYLLLGGGAVLLVAARVLRTPTRRREERLYREYLQWKKGLGEYALWW